MYLKFALFGCWKLKVGDLRGVLVARLIVFRRNNSLPIGIPMSWRRDTRPSVHKQDWSLQWPRQFFLAVRASWSYLDVESVYKVGPSPAKKTKKFSSLNFDIVEFIIFRRLIFVLRTNRFECVGRWTTNLHQFARSTNSQVKRWSRV